MIYSIEVVFVGAMFQEAFEQMYKMAIDFDCYEVKTKFNGHEVIVTKDSTLKDSWDDYYKKVEYAIEHA